MVFAIEICFLTVLKSRGVRLKHRQSRFLLRPLFWVYQWLSSPSVFMGFSLGTYLCPNLLFLKRHRLYWIRAHLVTSFCLNYLFKDPYLQIVTF